MPTLTPRQKEVYEFVEDYQMMHGSSPTIAEIKHALQVSSDNGVLKHLKALEEKGLIERSNTPRGIGLLSSVKEKLFADNVVLPLLGAVPAGNPVESFETAEDWMVVADRMVPDRKACFLLRVKGESMKNAGILDRDIVIVHATKRPKEGDYVVALVDNESTVKTLKMGSKGFFLRPENPDFDDIHPAQDLQIQGVVIGLLRNYS